MYFSQSMYKKENRAKKIFLPKNYPQYVIETAIGMTLYLTMDEALKQQKEIIIR